jgi:hypothetical protein
MSNQELQDYYELFVLGVADPTVTEAIQEKLAAGDAETVRAVAKARELVAGLALTAPLVEPPEELAKRVLGSVQRESKGFGGWLWAWAAATALLALMAFNFWQRERTKAEELAIAHREAVELSTRLASVSQILEFLNEPELKIASFGTPQPQPPRGRVLASANRGVLLLVSNLPPAASGRTYEMWLVPKTGAPVPAGLFQSASDGRALHLRPGGVDLSTVAAIAVSDEPAAGSSAPTTTPFIAVPLAE